MNPSEITERLKELKAQMKWLLVQAEDYESGRAQAYAENAIYADHKAKEMAAKCRRRAGDLATLIAAYKQVDA